jgi:hypothetical protein
MDIDLKIISLFDVLLFCLLPCCEYLLESILELVNIVIYQVLFVNFVFVYQTNQGQRLVNFLQVQHHVLVAWRVVQLDRG